MEILLCDAFLFLNLINKCRVNNGIIKVLCWLLFTINIEYCAGSGVRSLLVGNDENVYVGRDDVIEHFHSYDVTQARADENVNISIQDGGGPNFPSVFKFILINGTEHVLRCGSGYARLCYVTDPSNISDARALGHDEADTFGSPGHSVVVNITMSANTVVYVGISFNNSVPATIHAISRKRITRNGGGYNVELFTEHNLDDLHLKPKDGYSMEFIHGLLADGFVYFLSNRRSPNGNTGAFVSQICTSAHYFNAYVEAPLECKGYANIRSAVSVSTPRGAFLLAAFQGDERHRGSALCMYNITRVATFFVEVHEKCFREAVGSAPDWIRNVAESCKAPMVLHFV